MENYNNPTISLEDLNIFEQKVNQGTISQEDLELINKFMTSIGLQNFLLDKLRELNVLSFEEYVLKVTGRDNDSTLEARLRGTVLGVISALRTYLK
ncbi:hypothetical protein CLV59_105131 [Chitinophaga dinghuensis]|uniref:Uncharacterized protein n=1 Tax=Chitinophaga dinghuensis TaxID=1539050 RepID=A0A327VYZ4_9BACT|nr:hypothetical protein [Chitinophaga dinghuensis]RAJ80024.1 hypothetical protein CLV59_105131 [Chitinophaga dinghuensis]